MINLADASAKSDVSLGVREVPSYEKVDDVIIPSPGGTFSESRPLIKQTRSSCLQNPLAYLKLLACISNREKIIVKCSFV